MSVTKTFLGIDFGAETIKMVELALNIDNFMQVRRHMVDHGQRPAETIQELLAAIFGSGRVEVHERFDRRCRGIATPGGAA